MDQNPFDALEEVREFFDEEPYDLQEVYQTSPGKDLAHIYDKEQDSEKTIIWEGGDEYSYEQDGRIQELPGDDALYDIAAKMMHGYEHGLTIDSDGRPRARTATLSKSGGESSRALNEPMEWGIETGNRHWGERDMSLLGRLFKKLD